MRRLAKALSVLFGPQNAQEAVDSSLVRRGDGIYEAFTGGASAGAPSEHSALTVSAIYASVTLISGAIASMSTPVFRVDSSGESSRDPDHPATRMFNLEMHPRWTAASGWSFLSGSKLLHGDAFAEIKRSRNGAPVAIAPLHPNRVRVVVAPDGMRLLYEVQPDPTIDTPSPEAARVRVLDQDDVLHVTGFGFNGKRSLSPLRHALSVSGRLAINAQNFTTRFLENSGQPAFALRTEQQLTDAQFDTLRTFLDDHTGPMNAGRPMILEGGLQIDKLTMPLEDMQLLEARKFQVEEIARIYGIPPFMIGHMEKTSSWGTGVEAMGTGFVRYALREHLVAFEAEINRKLFRDGRHVLRFDTTDLERADQKSLYESMRIALGRAGEPAILTQKEARQVLNFPAEPDGTYPATTQEVAE